MNNSRKNSSSSSASSAAAAVVVVAFLAMVFSLWPFPAYADGAPVWGEGDYADIPISYGEDYSAVSDHIAVGLANIAIGGLVGCVGAELNHGNWRCLDGLWRGSIGGFVTYGGMEIGARNAEIPFAGLVGRQVANIGSSMIANAAFERGTFEQVETDIGPIQFVYNSSSPSPSSPGGSRLTLSIRPLSAIAIGYYAVFIGGRINVVDSIEDGTVSFNFGAPGTRSLRLGMPKYILGNTVSNIPIYVRGCNWCRSHEFIHSVQPGRWNLMNDVVSQPLPVFRPWVAEGFNALTALPSNIIGSHEAFQYAPMELEAYILEH